MNESNEKPAAGDAVAWVVYRPDECEYRVKWLNGGWGAWTQFGATDSQEIRVPAAAPKPAAPPSVTVDAVRALVAKWREAAKEIDGRCDRNRMRDDERQWLEGKAEAIEDAADQLEALTHPGHKHAQEDAAAPASGAKRCELCNGMGHWIAPNDQDDSCDACEGTGLERAHG